VLVSLALALSTLGACQGPSGPAGSAGSVNPASIVSRPSGNYGKDIVVYGSGFMPSEVVDIYLGDSRIGTTRSSTRGTFWAELAISDNLERLFADELGLVGEVRAVGNNGSQAAYPIELDRDFR
ncbi:MAG: hypothetical protein AAB037_06175, partial [Chloroflexota bacterium]